MPRGRPRKDSNSTTSVVKKPKQKMKAVFIDSIDTIDPDTGYRVDLNIYRIQPKAKKQLSEDEVEQCIYVGFDSDFIDNLEKDIVPTPLGSAEIIDDDAIEEEDDTDFDF